MSMKYLNDVESAEQPGPLVQDNFEELELLAFERQPRKLGGVPTTREGPPQTGDGNWTVGQTFVDALRAVYICTVAGDPGTWRQLAPAPGAFPIPASNIDWFKAGLFTKTLGANTTFTFSNAMDGSEIVVLVTNTASNFTVGWPGTIKWQGGAAPTQTTGAKTDIYRFKREGGVIYGWARQNF